MITEAVEPYPTGAYCHIDLVRINADGRPTIYWRAAISEKTLTATRPHPWAFEQEYITSGRNTYEV